MPANGLIDANPAGNTLTNQTQSGVTNQGIMLASNGGILALVSTNYNNAGGQIQALNESEVQLSSSLITGGTLSSSGGGLIRIANGTSNFMADVTMIGSVALNSSTQLRIENTITNTGSIVVNPWATLGSEGPLR